MPPRSVSQREVDKLDEVFALSASPASLEGKLIGKTDAKKIWFLSSVANLPEATTNGRSVTYELKGVIEQSVGSNCHRKDSIKQKLEKRGSQNQLAELAGHLKMNKTYLTTFSRKRSRKSLRNSQETSRSARSL